ncbi:MAG: hypothetical protein WCQ47_07400 [bacterium]
MNKKKLLLVTNIILLLSFVIMLTTIVLMQMFRSKIVFEIHEKSGIVLVVAAIMHTYLNWAWVRLNILKRKG